MDKHQTTPLVIIVLAWTLVVLAVFVKADQILFTALTAFAGGMLTGAFALLNSNRTAVPEGNTTSTLTQVTVPPPTVALPEDFKEK